MLIDIQMDRRMEHGTTSHGADAASNPMTRGVKSGFTYFLHLSPLSRGALLDRDTKRRHRQYALFIIRLRRERMERRPRRSTPGGRDLAIVS